MRQLQEINVLLKKRIAHLEKKKQKCLDYSSTPNKCANKINNQIRKIKGMARIANLRKRTMESDILVDSYLDMLFETSPKSPISRVATYGVGILGTYQIAKSAVKRKNCKQYKYSPYLYKRCVKGLDEAKQNVKEYYKGGDDVNQARRLGPVYGPKHIEKVKKEKERLGEAEGWEKMPKGWKQSSLKKFSKSLTGKKATQKGFFDKCVKRMKGKLDNPEAFCASVKDERHGSTFWRGKGKTPQQAGKDVKRIQNVKRG